MAETAPAAFPAFTTREGEARYVAAYDAVLREWPVPCRELDLPTRLGTTHVIAGGPEDAPPLVLLPSFAGSATLWRPNVAALSEAFRTYAVDVVGQPGKSVLARRISGPRDFADWLADVLDGLGVRRASIVGSSYGAFLALNQAMLTPEGVDRVVLIGPAGTFVGGLWWVFLRGMLTRLVKRKKARSITDLLGGNVVLHPADAAWDELMRITMAEAARPSLVSPRVFSKAELAAVKSPVLLLVGEHERIYDAGKAVERARERMPGVQAEIVPRAHHLAALARPAEVNRRILAFLQQGGG